VKLSHAFLVTLFAREATLLATFVNAAILARGLGPPGLGSYLLVVAIANLLAQGFCLGLNYSNAIMVAKNPLQAGRLFSISAIPLLLYIPVAMGAYWIGPDSTSWLVGGMPAGHRVQLLIATGILVYSMNVGGVVFGQERYRGYNAITLIPSLGLCLTNATLMIADALTVDRVILGWTVWTLVGAVLMTILLAARVRPEFRMDLPLFRELLTMGGKALLCAILGFTTTRAMHILLNRQQGAGAVGQYGAMLAFADLLGHAPGILSWILMNKASAQTVSPAHVARLLRIHSVLSLLGGFALAGLAPFVLKKVFGAGFAQAPVALWILLAGSYCVGYWSISSGYFTGKQGYPPITVVLVALSTGLTLGLGMLLIPRLDLVGAAIAWSSATVIVAALSVGVFLRQCREQVGWRDLLLSREDVRTLQSVLSGLLSARSAPAAGKGP